MLQFFSLSLRNSAVFAACALVMGGCTGGAFSAADESVRTTEAGVDADDIPSNDPPDGTPDESPEPGGQSDPPPPQPDPDSSGGAGPVDAGSMSGGATPTDASSPPVCPAIECPEGSPPTRLPGATCETCEPIMCLEGTPCDLIDCVAGIKELGSGCCECEPISCDAPAAACDEIECADGVRELGAGCCECELPACGGDEFRELADERRDLLRERANECLRDSDCKAFQPVTACGKDCWTGVRIDYLDEFLEELNSEAKKICNECEAAPRSCPGPEPAPRCVFGRCGLATNSFN